MKHKLIASITILFALLFISAAANAQRGKESPSNQIRTVSGQVLTADDAPLSGAVVYLKNTKSLAIKSYISEKDGGYRFLDLSPNVDYQVWAESNGAKTSVKTVSSFDSRNQFTINLHLGK